MTKNIKAIIAMIIVAIMVASMAACGKTDNPSNPSNNQSNTETQKPDSTQPTTSPDSSTTEPSSDEPKVNLYEETAKKQEIYLLSSVEIPFEQANFSFLMKDENGEYIDGRQFAKDYFEVCTVATFFISSGDDFNHSSSLIKLSNLPTMERIISTSIGTVTDEKESLTDCNRTSRQTVDSSKIPEENKGYLKSVRIAGHVDWDQVTIQLKDKSDNLHDKTLKQMSYEDLKDTFTLYKINGVHYFLYQKWWHGTHEIGYIFTPVDGEYKSLPKEYFDVADDPEMTEPHKLELNKEHDNWCDTCGAFLGSTGLTLYMDSTLPEGAYESDEYKAYFESSQKVKTGNYKLIIHTDEGDIEI